MASPPITLRISGLGHTHTLNIPSSQTVGALKEEIGSLTGIPKAYQRLLARGTKLEDDNLTLLDAHLKDRTKVMLLHNQLYAQEKDGFEVLAGLQNEIKDLEEKQSSVSAKALHELVTQLCCRLDAVDIQGSDSLRTLRKQLLRRAELIDQATTDNLASDE